jgi:hypothetical protein
MATLADHYCLPSKEEIRTIKSEIIALENEVIDAQKVIAQTQLRIKQLNEQLNERKSRIAPVRKASFDILSSIFERCSEIDWKLPLTIAAVSRRWRETILHTPRAWCFIDISNLDEALIHAYFERSGYCCLHIAVDSSYRVKLLTPVAHRIQCLVVPLLSIHLRDLTFPRLTRLRTPLLGDIQDWCELATITSSRFPNLRHLELRNLALEADNCEQLPFLQTLSITAVNIVEWGGLFSACKNSLVSLQITSSDIPQVPQIELPNLRYLKIVDEAQTDRSWASPLVTPALRVYWEESEWSVTQQRRESTQSITHLRLKRVPFTLPTQLRVLQLDLSIFQFRSVISGLKNRPSLCPHLEIIEFGRRCVGDSSLEEMEKTLGECDWQSRLGLVRPPTITAKWGVSLPDEIEAEVGDRWRFESY